MELLYTHLLWEMFGVNCDKTKYTEENAFRAWRDKWQYEHLEHCDNTCDLQDLIRKSNYGCSEIEICEDKTISCNILVDVRIPTSTPCRTINVSVT